MKSHERDQFPTQSEKRNSIPEVHFDPDPELVKQGWERRFITDPDQVKDTLQLYTDLGFEIHIEPVKPTELSAICGECRLVTCNTFVTIYTRKSKSKFSKNINRKEQ